MCADGAAVDLFALLGGAPNAGGAWTAPGGGAATNTYMPGTSAPGIYTYIVTAAAPCANDQATVTVAQNNPVNAGTDAATTVCADGAVVDLFALLGSGPTTGGTWTAPGGGAATNTYTPGTSAPGVYTYTVTAAPPCVNAQATVTVTQNNPVNAGTDAATTVCADGAVVDLFALLGGAPNAGGTWIAPGGGAATNTYTPGTSAPGVYTYTVTAAAPCVNDQATVIITQNNPVNAGSDGAATLCISNPEIALFAELGGSPNAGGTWTGPGGTSSNGTFTPGASTPGIYTYAVMGTAPCPSDQSTVTVTVTSLPDPGTNGNLALCANAAPLDLFTALGGAPDAGGTWTGPGGGSIPMPFDPAVNPAGLYTYTITVPPPCVSVTSTVTITIQQPPNAGTNGAILLCISSPATNLFASLGGTPNAGGTWTAPGGGASTGIFSPGTSVPGVYTYTVPGTAPCPDATATVTVAVSSLPDPGTNGAVAVCASGALLDLFASLGGTPDTGGQWTAPGGGAHGNTFNPAADPVGVYTYTITVPPPCVSVSATVTVAVVQPSDPGVNGSLALCISSPAVPLFTSLGGSPDVGGSWTAPGGGATTGTFTPGTSTAGLYTYTVSGTTPCPNAVATVNVTVVSEPDPGTNGALVICATGTPADLFTLLGGTPDAGGTWTSPGGAAHGNMFDPTVDVAGPYTYTITVPPPCVSQSAVVNVTIQQPPNAGTNGALTLCISGSATPLITALGGSPNGGGTWTAPGGGAFNGIFIPGTSMAGAYTYTVLGAAPCPNASSTVSVTVTSEPDPGVNGAMVLCTTGAVEDLFASLGGTPDAGGSWTGPGGNAHGAMFDPSVDVAGNYTYTLSVPPPCTSASSTVTVLLQSPPNAGTNGSITLCATSATTPLFTQLGGSPNVGGTWTAPGGGVFNGTFVPGSSVAGTYTYTVNGVSPCLNSSAAWSLR